MARTGPVPPYGEAIQQAVASGDLAKMKAVAKEAAAYLKAQAKIPAALDKLNAEIAKLEKKSKKG